MKKQHQEYHYPKSTETWKFNSASPPTEVKKEEKVAPVKKEVVPDVIQEGTKIILPVGCSNLEAITLLQRKEAEDTKVIDFFYEFPKDHPLDALNSFMMTLKDIYGWVDVKSSGSGWFSQPPVIMEVQVSPTERKQLVLGRMKLPGVQADVNVHIQSRPGAMSYLIVHGKVKQVDNPKIKALIDTTRKHLRDHSIYRGQAIKLSFKWLRDGEDFDATQHSPEFLSIGGYGPEALIFTTDVMSQIQAGLWTPIVQAEACRRAGIPLKRGILLESKYGMGKTLTAYVTAKLATEAGWSFVYLASIYDLKMGLDFAYGHLPAVLFCEDVDQFLGTQERGELINQLLNTIDGIDSKRTEVITVFTTNDVKSINKAFLRPGRIDTVISLFPPNAEAATKLLKLYGGNLLQKEFNYEAIADKLAGRSPAMIRETVELSKLSTIARTGGVLEGEIAASDIVEAIRSLDAYNRLTETQPVEEAPMTLAVHLPPGMSTAVKNGESVIRPVYAELTAAKGN